MNKTELKKALEEIGLALNAVHNTVTTDIPEIEPTKTSWRVDHAHEVRLLAKIENALFNTDTGNQVWVHNFDFVTKATTEFCLEYTHQGKKWALNFFAESWEDAERKVQSIKESLVLLGKLEESIPAQ